MMRGTTATIVWTALAVLVLLGIGALAVVLTGAYDVAATTPHTGLTTWALNTLQKQSVAARVRHVEEPPVVGEESLRRAFATYESMCAVCHGAPGRERGEIGKGITPTPPRLEQEASEWSEREIFWILRHGIKLAGMPAFGPTHDDRELWALAQVVRRLPQTTPEEYRRLAGAGSPGADAHQH